MEEKNRLAGMHEAGGSIEKYLSGDRDAEKGKFRSGTGLWAASAENADRPQFNALTLTRLSLLAWTSPDAA
jgi:hypothetical protein